MAYDGKIESVIALPKGIIPHWREDMVLVVLSHNNKDILFMDANQPYFSKRKGRRNTIYRVGQIAETVKKRSAGRYAALTALHEISAESLSPAYYFQKSTDRPDRKTLVSVTDAVFRSQRVQSNTEADMLPYHEIGLMNIVRNGYTVHSNSKKHGNPKRIGIFKLKPLDILISLRGNAGTVGIIGEHEGTLICNAGLICIRPKDEKEAYGLYLYLRSDKGREALDALYDESPNRTINPETLETLTVPNVSDPKAKEYFEDLMKLQEEISVLEENIHRLVNK